MAKPRGKILCIEDDREAAALIAEELVARGFQVALAYGGHEGLLAIMKDTPDLVLCDISVPGMTGFEVLETLTSLAPRFGRIPLIFLTALADRDTELKGRRLGADDYVTKPIDFEWLAIIIDTRLADMARRRLPPSATILNKRQIQVLTLVARGQTSAKIARQLRLSKRTVDFHINKARIRLHAANRAEAASKAVAEGLIKPETDPC
jgi:DNA-binding NarL/FixJ family response regulator